MRIGLWSRSVAMDGVTLRGVHEVMGASVRDWTSVSASSSMLHRGADAGCIGIHASNLRYGYGYGYGRSVTTIPQIGGNYSTHQALLMTLIPAFIFIVGFAIIVVRNRKK